MGLVHAQCLEHWASVSCRLCCEICKCKYRGQRRFKYGVITSIIPFIRANWNFSRVLVFIQASLLFAIVNMEIGNYGFSVDDPDFPKPSSLFLLWALITFNLLVYYISFNIATVVEAWNSWRRSQFVFLLSRTWPGEIYQGIKILQTVIRIITGYLFNLLFYFDEIYLSAVLNDHLIFVITYILVDLWNSTNVFYSDRAINIYVWLITCK